MLPTRPNERSGRPTGSLFGHRLYAGLAVLVFMLLFTSYGSTQSPVDDVLASLSLEQKVAQMFMVSLYGDTLLEVEHEFLQQWQPGGIVLFKRNTGTPAAVTALTNAYQETITGIGGVPLLIAIDQEGGVIAHLKDGFTEWPVPMLVTAASSSELAYTVGKAMAEELLAVGVNMDLAPVADLNTNVNNPIIGRRSFGSDPVLTAPIIGAFIHGMQEAGVLATAKHFPGHGDTDADSHVVLPVVPHERERLETVELAPFRAAIAAGTSTIMVAHIWFPALDTTENMPASLSPVVVDGLLRETLGYDGLIMTDALDMDAIDTAYTPETAAVMAVQAGNDLIAIGANVGFETQGQAIQAVIDAVRAGEIDEGRIDASVRRILDAKERYAILDWQPLAPNTVGERLHLAEHAELVTELFQAGTTLVYDRNSVLPLLADEQIVLVYPATRPRIRQACQNSGTFRAVDVSEYPTDAEIEQAARAGAQADKIVVFTQNADTNRRQQVLVEQMPPDKVVLVALWSPYDRLYLPDVGAYLVTYSPLNSGLSTVCNILFGLQAPNGRLPVNLDRLYPAGMGTTYRIPEK